MNRRSKLLSFQEIIFRLEKYWQSKGCVIIPAIDNHVGAGTFHWATVFKALGDKDWNCCYHQACRRPKDGRFGENPNRLQHYYQFQTVLKPAPINSQDLYLESLSALGIDLANHDVRFVEDDWESPSLGATGLGYEVWLDGMEVSQFTYFQQIAGIELSPTSTEITYGLERLAMYIQDKNNVYDLIYSEVNNIDEEGSNGSIITYGDIFLQSEIEFCEYNFDQADANLLFSSFGSGEKEVMKLIGKELFYPAYDEILNLNHKFNLLDAKGVISTQERQDFILRIRELVKSCAKGYLTKHAKTNS